MIQKMTIIGPISQALTEQIGHKNIPTGHHPNRIKHDDRGIEKSKSFSMPQVIRQGSVLIKGLISRFGGGHGNNLQDSI